MLFYFSMYSRTLLAAIIQGSIDPTDYINRAPAVLFAYEETTDATQINPASVLITKGISVPNSIVVRSSSLQGPIRTSSAHMLAFVDEMNYNIWQKDN